MPLTQVCGQPHGDPLLPGVFHLGDFSHVGHRAARIEVGQDAELSGARQNIRALRHEVNAAEHDETGLRPCRRLRQLVAVAAEIGKADHLIALIMMSENDHIVAKFLLGGRNAVVHGVVRQDKIVVQ